MELNEKITDIIEALNFLQEDSTVPKNIRIQIKETIVLLQNNEQNISLRVDKSLELLSNLADDPNLPAYSRMQVWNIVSQLESN